MWEGENYSKLYHLTYKPTSICNSYKIINKRVKNEILLKALELEFFCHDFLRNGM